MTTDVLTESSSDNLYDKVRAPNWNEGATSFSSETPIASFDDLHLGGDVMAALADIEYHTPTEVQASCIPLIMAGIDLIVRSQTGTGKTAAFAIPAVEMLEAGTCKVEVLIIAPTRELAKQVGGEFSRIGDRKGIPVACVYGGTGFQQQFDDLERAQVVSATPGRLLDLLKRNAMTLEHLKLFVLDEADEMLNMGFEKELDAIVERLPAARQALMFSATVGEDIKRLAGHILTYPEYVSFSGDQVAAAEIKHIYYNVSGLGRLWDLNRIVDVEDPESSIVFCNTREDSFLVANFLRKQGYQAEVLNGDLPQRERELTLGKLRDGLLRFLVATDVAARGIDISGLSHVINFVLPESPETYIHRTGRTGRQGLDGIAISLISPREIGTYYMLRRIFKLEFVERELPTDDEATEAKERRVLDTILAKLRDNPSLDYGKHLAFADRLLAGEDARANVARLLAHCQGSAQAPITWTGVDEAALRARPKPPTKPAEKVAPAPEPAPDPEPVAEAPVTAEPQVEEMPQDDSTLTDTNPPDEAAAAEATEEPPPRRRRRRRRALPSADAGAAEEQETPPPPVEEPAEPARRRRRRGSSVRSVAEGAKSEKTEPEEAPKTPRRTRRTTSSSSGTEASASGPKLRRTRNGVPGPEADIDAAGKAGEPKPLETSGHQAAPVSELDEVPVDQGGDEPEADAIARITAPKPMVRLHVNIGSNKLGEAENVVSLLCELAGLEQEDFGIVTLRKRFCYVEAREDMTDDIIEAVCGQTAAGVTLKAELAQR